MPNFTKERLQSRPAKSSRPVSSYCPVDDEERVLGQDGASATQSYTPGESYTSAEQLYSPVPQLYSPDEGISPLTDEFVGLANTLHVMDDASRIATRRVGPDIFNTTTPATQYHLGDHLGSSNVVIDDQDTFINREDYGPYGETSFGSYDKKRYRFSGKERDEESGLYYHGAGYYTPWLARWTAPYPAGMVDGVNLYEYVRGNPVRLVDPDGRESDDLTSADGTWIEGPTEHSQEGKSGVRTLEWQPDDAFDIRTADLTSGDRYRLQYAQDENESNGHEEEAPYPVRAAGGPASVVPQKEKKIDDFNEPDFEPAAPEFSDVEVWIWEGAGHGASSFGHVSIRIDDISYSYGPGGMEVEEFSEYFSRNLFRGARVYDVNISGQSKEVMHEFLESYNEEYHGITNNCVTPLVEALNKAGLEVESRTRPTAFAEDLEALESDKIGKSRIVHRSAKRDGPRAPWAPRYP